jgi:hypothetical protein
MIQSVLVGALIGGAIIAAVHVGQLYNASEAKPAVTSVPLALPVAKSIIGLPQRSSTNKEEPDRDAPNGMREVVWQKANMARDCAIAHGQISSRARLAIIDYDLPSSSRRLWIVDRAKHKVLLSEWVAHGSGSGELMAKSFSNQEGSLKTSLGVFRVGEVYEGKHGQSLRMDGLERGFNDQARARGVVMHSAWYANPDIASKTGRLGRSQGCPAVREKAFAQVEGALRDGGMLFSYSIQGNWLARSQYLHCG